MVEECSSNRRTDSWIEEEKRKSSGEIQGNYATKESKKNGWLSLTPPVGQLFAKLRYHLPSNLYTISGV